ncbi:carboxypeptidase s [Phaffia rhodozyma]|uniref:Carboxypeptidase s n=1 Tax=Phaffia rhodozyma TaxID=264483 RepID=A0A0F7SYC9_PHARH|nr:carboxypeptidase s [Phaffia rhodozyma]
MSLEEKHYVLPSPGAAVADPPAASRKITKILLFQWAFLFGCVYLFVTVSSRKVNSSVLGRQVTDTGEIRDHGWSGLEKEGRCPTQVDPLDIGSSWHVMKDNAYAAKAAARLQRAIQIPGVSYDDLPRHVDPLDPVWKEISRFNEFLDLEFPTVTEHLDLEIVNSFARLYTWKGTDPSLKPILLMAHMDVVPVPDATVHRWTHPPFEGKMDKDGWIWGRGSADCKNTLLAILAVAEKLIEEGFEPERTILLSFGFDEEIGGPRGAGPLADLMLKRYGPNGISFLVDEGFTGVDEAYGAKFASLGLAEKGSMNLVLEVDTPGGHSSVPPEHTSIGILSLLITHLEASPFRPKLTAATPYLKYLQCAERFGPDMPTDLKRRIRNPAEWDDLAEEIGEDRTIRAFLGTTQAVDIFSGGIKSNALPEVATAVINYRIDFLSSVNETYVHTQEIVSRIARSLNMTLDISPLVTADSIQSHDHAHVHVDAHFSNGLDDSSILAIEPHSVSSSSYGIRMKVQDGRGLEPAPITPAEGKVFELVAGTTRKVFEPVGISPSGMIANTDTKWDWNLTEHIYRFVPASLELVKNFHTVDERIHIDAHLSTTEWFYKLLQNSQGWRD